MWPKFIINYIEPEVEATEDKTDSTFYDCEEERINIGYEEDDCGFMEHIVRKHKYPEAYDFSLELWTILHEIGHYETPDVEESDREYDIRLACACIPKTNDKKVTDRYFNLSREWAATEWAIDYVEEHKALCKMFDKLLEMEK